MARSKFCPATSNWPLRRATYPSPAHGSGRVAAPRESDCQPVLRFLVLPRAIVNSGQHQVQLERRHLLAGLNDGRAGFHRHRRGAKMPAAHIRLKIFFDSCQRFPINLLHHGRGRTRSHNILERRDQLLELWSIIRAQQQHMDQRLGLQPALRAGTRPAQNCLQRNLRIHGQSPPLFDRQFPNHGDYGTRLLDSGTHISQSLVEPCRQPQSQLPDRQLPVRTGGSLESVRMNAANHHQIAIRARQIESRRGFIGPVRRIFSIRLKTDDESCSLPSYGPSRLKYESPHLLQIAQSVARAGFACVRINFEILGAFANPPGLRECSTSSQQSIEEEFF